MDSSLQDRPPAQERETDLFDIEIGRRLQKLRIQQRHSQTQLGSKLGVTFQQVQKYEKGRNSISLYKLLKICAIFNVDFSYFITPPINADSTPSAELSTATIRAMTAFSKLNPKTQKTLLNFMEALDSHDES
jgi:transcriptional regulator with XRE-family HTH domain